MTQRKPTGYAVNQEINRAINANNAARKALMRIIEEQPGPQATAMLIAKAAAALGENLDALHEIEKVSSRSQSPAVASDKKSAK